MSSNYIALQYLIGTIDMHYATWSFMTSHSRQLTSLNPPFSSVDDCQWLIQFALSNTGCTAVPRDILYFLILQAALVSKLDLQIVCILRKLRYNYKYNWLRKIVADCFAFSEFRLASNLSFALNDEILQSVHSLLAVSPLFVSCRVCLFRHCDTCYYYCIIIQNRIPFARRRWWQLKCTMNKFACVIQTSRASNINS